MTNRRMPSDLWEQVQNQLPIFCVDVLPIDRGGDGSVVGTVEGTVDDIRVGLILRDTPEQGERWCFIGGRLLIDETVAQAVERELASAVGDSLDVSPTALRHTLVEYPRTRVGTGVWDPRKQAISATVPLFATGDGQATGDEALEFKWWPLAELNGSVMGFGQESVVAAVVETALADERRR